MILVSTLIYFEMRVHKEPIKVGLLHSHTGTMALSESNVYKATLYGLDKLNKDGGLLGHKIVPVVADGRSDPHAFADQAQRLISEDNVSVIFGCWTSASRKMVKEEVEKADHLLMYPIQYEGIENSPNIVYTGSLPNQQIKPAVKWALDHLGGRFFLLGSDYIYPRIANTIIKDLASFLDAEVVGEHYVLLGEDNFTEVIAKLNEAKPDVIFNTLNGSSNNSFISALQNDVQMRAHRTAVFSFSIAEPELRAIISEQRGDPLTNYYAAWSYFQSLNDQENKKFIAGLTAFLGEGVPVSDPMVSAYESVLLWAAAVEEAGSFNPRDVRRTIGGQSRNGPGGIIYIDPKTLHSWKMVKVGRLNDQGSFEIVWDSGKPIRPEPFPGYLYRREWLDLEKRYYELWGHHWENHGERRP